MILYSFGSFWLLLGRPIFYYIREERLEQTYSFLCQNVESRNDNKTKECDYLVQMLKFLSITPLGQDHRNTEPPDHRTEEPWIEKLWKTRHVGYHIGYHIG